MVGELLYKFNEKVGIIRLYTIRLNNYMTRNLRDIETYLNNILSYMSVKYTVMITEWRLLSSFLIVK